MIQSLANQIRRGRDRWPEAIPTAEALEEVSKELGLIKRSISTVALANADQEEDKQVWLNGSPVTY